MRNVGHPKLLIWTTKMIFIHDPICEFWNVPQFIRIRVYIYIHYIHVKVYTYLYTGQTNASHIYILPLPMVRFNVATEMDQRTLLPQGPHDLATGLIAESLASQGRHQRNRKLKMTRLILMVLKSGFFPHQLRWRYSVSTIIYVFVFNIPNGGWAWDFRTINSIFQTWIFEGPFANFWGCV